jgi:hypothetical protein
VGPLDEQAARTLSAAARIGLTEALGRRAARERSA